MAWSYGNFIRLVLLIDCVHVTLDVWSLFLDTQEGTVWLVCYLNCIYQPLILCCGTVGLGWLINYSHVTIHWYLSCSCCDVILFYFLRHVSQELHFLLYFMFYGLLQCLFVCLCVCVCVCFMSMGFIPEINSCYAMLLVWLKMRPL